MSVVVNEVRAGFYLDSVALMRLSVELAALDGVEEAVAMIGTASNHAIMRDAGVLADNGAAAGPNDLVVALRAVDQSSARAALEHAAAALATRAGDGGASAEAVRPRSIAGALDRLPDANLAVISVPGAFAAREARKALTAGLNVMIFSDNVSLDEERRLKEEARERGLLVMGPDCGTAYVAGAPIAFANIVPRGRVGIVAASGTGLQEVAVLIARGGAGVSHGIGVGGRDLDDAIGGLSTLAAIDRLAADPDTDRIVLISKPPGARTATAVFERLTQCGKPAAACVLGLDATVDTAGVTRLATLKAAAGWALGHSIDLGDFDAQRLARAAAAALGDERRAVRGLYCGGTLATEAELLLGATRLEGGGHRVIDLGADEYTVGRPHPMIEPAVRTPEIEGALADPATAVVLLDVVLGLGAHPDPAGAVVRALAGREGGAPAVVASVCGTEQDPQGRAAQVAALEAAGVIVAPSNADAVGLAVRIAGRR